MLKVEVVTDDSKMKDAFSIRSTVFIEEQNVPEEEEIDQYEKDCTHFVVYDDSTPIGAGRIRYVDDYAKIERVCVLKEYRGTGAGKLLMENMEQEAIQQNVHKFVLHSQTHAEPFYTTIGYQTNSDIFMDAGIPHVAMEKVI
ncbi:GNAT family N-acetyltransferase [Pseudalkalibacillus sp. Hm43]|uniref:GNAT family N-acetyltransferase n=1 Tax=Pseudalkalibacillus sp. Hm43 TaxID=3450742 RepID=UPI003F43D290